MTKKRFVRISSDCIEHPSDKAAMKAMKNTAGFDRMVKFVMGLGLEPVIDYLNRSNYVRCSEKQCPELYALFKEAVEVLDISPEPPLFLAHSPAVNAWTFGSKRPYVVVTSALVEGFTDAEVQCVMGHELGHILAGHSLYRTVATILVQVMNAATKAVGNIVALPAMLLTRGLLSALFYWMRCAELTADRAGLLVAQDPMVVYSTDTKLAAGPGKKIASQLSVEAFLEQAREFVADDETKSRLVRFMLEDMRTHPFPVVRVRELEDWVKSGAFQEIVDGEWSKRPNAAVALAKPPREKDPKAAAVQTAVLLALSRVIGVHSAPRIPERALHTALEKFAPCDESEETLALYEQSNVGGGSGVLLTDVRLFTSERPHLPIKYEDMEMVEAVSGGLFRSPGITINGDELVLSFHNTETRDGVLAAILAAQDVSLTRA